MFNSSVGFGSFLSFFFFLLDFAAGFVGFTGSGFGGGLSPVPVELAELFPSK